MRGSGRTDVPRHAFTVDVEDWYDGIPISAAAKQSAERRLHVGMDRLLELLDGAGHKATFFVLGPVAQQNADLLRRLDAAGHEVGCHGWSHDLLYTMDRRRFKEETRRAADAIASLIGRPVTAYRAAYFSITRESFWALEILAELGFRYDSSIFPVVNWRYGIPDFSPDPQVIETAAGPIYELPLSVRPVFGRNVPLTGGAYFRLYPYAVTRANMRWAERHDRPVVFYLHPWELDPGHPRVDFPAKPRFTHYVNLRSAHAKLAALVSEFRFGTLSEVLEDEIARSGP